MCLKIVQNKVIRIIDRLKYNSSTANSYKKHKILQFDELVNLELSKSAFQFVNKKLPINVQNMFRNNSFHHNYNTRFKKNPRIEKHTSKYYNTSYLCQVPNAWMNLKTELKEKNKLKSFVRNYKIVKFS